MESKHTTYTTKEKIELTDKERELFKLFTDFVKEKNVKTVIRVAGGWVRDKVIGRENHDIDFALEDMMGEDFIKQAHEYFKEKTSVRGFGVTKFNPEKSKHLEAATIEIMGMWIDVVNLRGEAYDPDSRIPKITIGTPEEDAFRRDLTINALFYNLHTEQVEDFTKRGLEDLRAGIARTPLEPEKTFTDDPLRILRAFRFVSRFDLAIDEGIVNSLRKPEILDGLLKKVSKERVGTELRQMLQHPSVFKSIGNFRSYGLLPYMIEIPTTCKEINIDQALKAFERGTNLCEGLFTLLLKEDKYQFTTHLFEKYPAADARMMLNLSLLLGPFADYKCEIRKNKFENLLPILIRESLKLTNNDADISLIAVTSAPIFQNIAKAFLDGKARVIDIAKVIKEMKQWSNTWEISFIYACLSDVLNNLQDKEKVLNLYNQLYEFIYKNSLHISYDVKTLLDGKQISEKFGVKGQQIQVIKDNIFYWQIENPSKTLEDLVAEIDSKKDQFSVNRFN